MKDIINKDLTINRASLGSNPERNNAIKLLEKLEILNKQKLDSGEYDWVTITPEFGRPYKSLKKIKK